MLNEKAYNGSLITNINKIFTSLWINDRIILTGTKDNKLLAWDTNSNPWGCQSINLPDGSDSLIAGCGIHSISMNSSKTFLGTILVFFSSNFY